MISSVVFYPKKGVSLYSKGRISIFKMGVSQSLKGRGPKKFSGGFAPGPPHIPTLPLRGGWCRRWCRCRYRQILTSNVLNKQLHQNAESTSTGKVQCCRELNQNSFCVSIQVDTSYVRSLLTAGWPKFTLQTQLTNKNSTFAFRISSWHPKTL